MITEMDTGCFFSIEFVTANLETRKGGKLVAYANAMRLSNDIPEYVGTGRKGTGRGRKAPRPDNEVVKLHLPTEAKKTDRIRSVHLLLITGFNGKRVV